MPNSTSDDTCALCSDYGFEIRSDSKCPFDLGSMEQWVPARIMCGSKMTIDPTQPLTGSPLAVNKWELGCTVNPEPEPEKPEPVEPVGYAGYMHLAYAAMFGGVEC